MSAPAQGLVLIDGVAHAPDAARVSVFDRGFLYGDSVFEALRTYDGKPFALDRHVARLARSAELAAMRGAVDPDVMRAEIQRAVELGGFAESYVRVIVTRGQGTRLGLDPALAEKPLRVVIVLPLEPFPAPKYERGIGVVTYRTQRIADGTDAAGAKLGNYLLAVLASEVARASSADEALIVDREERVLEGATSNVFAVRAGRLITPPLSLGILAGITREAVIELASRAALPVEERALFIDELVHVDELFISSSIREIVPVVRVDGTTIGSGAPGPLSRALLQQFRRFVREPGWR